MILTYKDNTFILECTYAEKDIAKEAGFRWNPAKKQWQTTIHKVASIFKSVADESALRVFELMANTEQQSRLSATDFYVPSPDGKIFYPYQRAGVEYAASRDRVLIGDEPGLGKTAQAIGQINLLHHQNVLIICPASLKQNWRNELTAWLTEELTIGIAEGSKFPTTQIVIINYDIIAKNRAAIDARSWDFCVVDEAHYLKSQSAQRTVAILGGVKIVKGENGKTKEKVRAIQARRWCFLTGTPILNRPKELWTLAHFIAPEQFDNFFQYGLRYCAGFQEVINRAGDKAWNFNGASNLSELQSRVRGLFMVRRLKADVLTELPPKIRQILPIGDSSALKAEQKALKQLQAQVDKLAADKTYQEEAKKLRAQVDLTIDVIAKLRKAAAHAKLPAVFEVVDNLLESGQKCVIFAYHHEIIDELTQYYKDCCVCIDGRTKNGDRQPLVNRFQTDDHVKVFIGSIGAAGVGFTLTAASTVVFVELDWVPGNVAQAEDRCHRIGQNASVVNILHVVLEGSVDAAMAKAIVAKQNNIDKALDAINPLEIIKEVMQ